VRAYFKLTAGSFRSVQPWVFDAGTKTEESQPNNGR
jgi:hypothetical protein